MRHWLIKSEPDVYSIDDLARDGKTCWDGVRNYQARNLMRDEMGVGDLCLFHHSNADPPGVAGVARVCRQAYPDPTAFDPAHPHHDPRSTPEKPAWLMVDVEFVEKFGRLVSLEQMRSRPELGGLALLRRGMRLSVQPVTAEQFECIRAMGRS